MRDDFLNVKPGDPVTADKWNQMVKANRANDVLIGGENVRIQKLPHGTLVNAKHGGGFLHPWRTLVSPTSARVMPGLVNGQQPTIKDARGTEHKLNEQPPPLLPILDGNFNHNLGWIALELTVSDDYRTIKKAHVVQCDVILDSEYDTNNPFFFYGLPGRAGHKVRYPLARLERIARGRYNVFQVAMFNLNWIAKPPTPGQSAISRHFFWPV